MPGFTVPEASAGELALPEVALPEVPLPEVELPVDVRRPAAPGSGPQARDARPARLSGRGQRSGKGRNYQFRRS
ncbi:hypothetical protein O7608_13805 [Solwaraspora sp. WMMA2056]|uniref:hypothetical protein n=1 Tax=Solwaraspora sp. WMMA2056 TaxID=3015161 RepID=UPI00259BA6F0|nr:hypothetical protein [Solwaraspora sp. WMMA2056]WJK43376.1 hypothetical protein O7608_13805 [Solwaraspora sp. WMMA2056]